MQLETISGPIQLWVTQYLSVFCLVSIAVWAGSLVLWGKKWEGQVRDAGMYILSIGTLTLMLALRPPTQDVLFWSSLTWFCFSMLMVFELLWISYLIDAIFRALHEASSKGKQQLRLATTGSEPKQRTPYSRM